MKPRVGIFCADDWANLCSGFAQALRAAGTASVSYSLRPHTFDYANQSVVVTIDELPVLMNEYDVIIIGHSDHELLKYAPSGKTVIALHTGTKFRSNHVAVADLFSGVDLHLTDQCEFIGEGWLPKNSRYIAAAIDLASLPKFGHIARQPYIIGHYPSNPDIKGTTHILSMIADINPSKHILHSSNERISHADNLKRMDRCDIYVELFMPQLSGKAYGCHGVTAFEAAGQGKVVITQNIHRKVYENVYGISPFFLISDEDEFRYRLNYCLSMPLIEMQGRQTESFKSIERNHSLIPTGQYLGGIINDL